MKRLAIALTLLATATVRAENLIPFNSGFELGSPAGWYMWIDEKSTGNASFQTTEKDPHSGSYALQFDVKRAPKEAWQIALSLPQWTAKPATRYRLKFWAKGPGPIKVNSSDTDKNYAWMSGFSADLSPTQWTEVSGEIATTTQSGKGKVSVSVGLGQTAGTYFLDDFSVEEIVVPTK